jgi:hypothetical protein
MTSLTRRANYDSISCADLSAGTISRVAHNCACDHRCCTAQYCCEQKCDQHKTKRGQLHDFRHARRNHTNIRAASGIGAEYHQPPGGSAECRDRSASRSTTVGERVDEAHNRQAHPADPRSRNRADDRHNNDARQESQYRQFAGTSLRRALVTVTGRSSLVRGNINACNFPLSQNGR